MADKGESAAVMKPSSGKAPVSAPAFEKNPPPPGDEYEEIREQVRTDVHVMCRQWRRAWGCCLGQG